MARIDTHQHFWQYHPVRYSWITEDMSPIRRDFLPQHLKPLLQKNAIDGCVLVQAEQSIEHTQWMLSLADKHEFIQAVVGWINLESDRLEEELAQLHHQKLKGFRHILQDEKQRDYMLRPNFIKGVYTLGRLGYTYDILIFPDQLKFTHAFLKELPDQPFVVDHLAKPEIKHRKIEQWKEDIQAIAGFSNVYCKISGMVTEADWKHWKKEDFTPYMDIVVDAFGVDRLMFGSDWPVCLLAAAYDEVVSIVEDYFSSFSPDEKNKIFGGNAIQFYNIK